MNDFLKEPNGKSSTVRAMCFVCVLAACAMGLFSIWKDRDLIETAWLVAPYLIAAFGGKVTQKKYEK